MNPGGFGLNSTLLIPLCSSCLSALPPCLFLGLVPGGRDGNGLRQAAFLGSPDTLVEFLWWSRRYLIDMGAWRNTHTHMHTHGCTHTCTSTRSRTHTRHSPHTNAHMYLFTLIHSSLCFLRSVGGRAYVCPSSLQPFLRLPYLFCVYLPFREGPLLTICTCLSQGLASAKHFSCLAPLPRSHINCTSSLSQNPLGSGSSRDTL